MKNEKMKAALNSVNVGISFGVGLGLRFLIFYYSGAWIDGKLGTEPWFAFAGVLLAIGMSFYHLISELAVVKPGGSTDETSDDNDE